MFEFFIAVSVVIITLTLVYLYGSRHEEPEIPDSLRDAEKHARRRR